MTQAQALDIMMRGSSVFLTGPPGAGKTYVLNEFVRRAAKRHRRVAVTASTGIAATHIRGTTIHLWSGLGTRTTLTATAKRRLYANDGLRRRYAETDVLVIDFTDRKNKCPCRCSEYAGQAS
jgi:ATP-dependent DNA helicase PIF1